MEDTGTEEEGAESGMQTTSIKGEKPQEKIPVDIARNSDSEYLWVGRRRQMGCISEDSIESDNETNSSVKEQISPVLCSGLFV